jgi:hypothetical protein
VPQPTKSKKTGDMISKFCKIRGLEIILAMSSEFSIVSLEIFEVRGKQTESRGI